MTYAIPMGNTKIKILVGDKEVQQLQENLAEFRIEHNELKQILNPTPSDYYLMLRLSMFEEETKYDLSFFDYCKMMLDRGLAV